MFPNKFTLGTIVVNCIGALLIGFIMSILDIFSIDIKWKLFLVTGFLGGYTTFLDLAIYTCICYFVVKEGYELSKINCLKSIKSYKIILYIFN